MNDRDRLIELIGSFLGGIELTEITPPYGFENLADYLIAHGVTVQKHGRWEESAWLDECFWVCSNCKFPSEAIAAPKLYNYCPNCGARMDLGDTNGK